MSMTNTAATTSTSPILCGRCGRPLTSPRSISAATRNGGYGRGCAAKIAAAEQATNATPAAVELIEDAAIVRTAPALFLAVSSDGSTRYEVNPAAGTCTCKAGQYGRSCKHLAAAIVLIAA